MGLGPGDRDGAGQAGASVSLPRPADYGLDGEFATEADRVAARDRYLADWYLARALDRDGHLTAAEGEAKLEVVIERIRDHALRSAEPTRTK